MKTLLVINAVVIYASLLLGLQTVYHQDQINTDFSDRVECLELGLIYVGDGICVVPKTFRTLMTTATTNP